ncbi:MAG TPA: hypothetical protein VIJ87_19675 [Pyrinomonadaceae bacterium]
MVYTPHREIRYDYIWDLMADIEERQCQVCIYRSDREEYPMCFEIEGKIITEDPVEELIDLDAQGVVCTKFKLGEPLPPTDPDQLHLFDT